MNAESETQPSATPAGRPMLQGTGLAWAPIPVLAGAMLAGRLAGLRASYENEALTLVLSFMFYTLVSLGTLWLVGRSFLKTGSPGLLLLECGVILWSLAGTVGDLVGHGDANLNVTIFNASILLAGVCHLAGAALALQPPRALRLPPLWLGAGGLGALGALGLVTRAARAGWLPVFFIPGQGGTLVRYGVLVSAIALFVLAAGLVRAGPRAGRPAFAAWYSLALLLLAVGLFGIMLQTSLGSLVNWLGRTAQWLGGVYLLVAAGAALRASDQPLLPRERGPRPERYGYAVALAVVLAAAALRLAFLQALGTHAAFLTFYPAVMLAALYGGLRAGALATVLSGALADFFWIEPTEQFGIRDPGDGLSLAIFLLSGLMISWITEGMRRAQARAIEARAEARGAAALTAAARESEARYRSLFEGSLDAIFTLDMQGGFVMANPAATRMSGRSAAELAQLTFVQLCAPDRLDEAKAAFQECLAGTARELQTAIIRKDGRRMELVVSSTPLRTNGSVTGILGIASDLTERRRAEAAEAVAHWQVQSIIDNTTAMIYAFDLEERFVLVNTAVAALLHSTPEEMIGKRRHQFMPQEDADWHEANDRQVIQAGRALEFEEHSRFEDHTTTWLTTKFPLRDAQGSIYAVAGISTDVSERKRAELAAHQRAEEALHLSAQEFHSLAEAVPQIVWATRPDGWNIYFNQQWVDYTGMTMAESYGHGWNTPFHPEDKQRAWEAWQRATQHNERYSLDCRLRRHDGVYRWWLIRGEPMRGPNGEILKWFGTCTDIEDLKRAQAELIAANQELEAFCYSVSHDLRAPLRTMDGFSQAVLEDYGPQLDATGRDYLGRVRRGGQQMGQLIDDLLNLSRLGRAELNPQAVSLTALAHEVARQLHETNPAQTVECRIAEGMNATGDKGLLRVVVWNLLENAWKFTRRRPNALIEFGTGGAEVTRPQSATRALSSTSTVFFVRDNGAGFNMKYLGKMFRPFQRLHGTTEFPGTGIGLANVQRVVRRHGGRIWAEGEEGRGATFYFTLEGSGETAPEKG